MKIIDDLNILKTVAAGMKPGLTHDESIEMHRKIRKIIQGEEDMLAFGAGIVAGMVLMLPKINKIFNKIFFKGKGEGNKFFWQDTGALKAQRIELEQLLNETLSSANSTRAI